MEFKILGPLEVWERGRPLPLGGAKQRALLAIFLLHANEVVARDTLIDELWGERPPASAPHTLEAYVSRLRKTLPTDRSGEPVLVTRAPGYMLRVGFDELDLHRFERHADEGRRALATHAPERAADKLRQALALWRGRPLSDVEFEQFARIEIERLEELRLQAFEERIEADLALGRNETVVPELETLVAQNPLRERLRGQLMLALYRSGRQAEALHVYKETRSFLNEELGLEPGPALRAVERAILRQEDVLGVAGNRGVATVSPRPPLTPPAPQQPEAKPEVPPPSAEGGEAAPAGRSRRRLLVAGAGAAVVLAAASAVATTLLRPDGSVSALDENTLALVASDGEVHARVQLQHAPTRLAAGLGALWVTSFDSQTVSRIDVRRREVRRTIRVGSGPTGVAAGSGGVWVANSLEGTLSRIDPETDRVAQTIKLGSRPTDLVFAAGSLWVASETARSVFRIDPGRRPRRIKLDAGPTTLARGGGSLWAASDSNRTVTQIDPTTNAVARTIAVGGGPAGMTYAHKALWVANSLDGTISRIDPEREVVTATTAVGNGPVAIAVADGDLWITNQYGGTVALVDPASARVLARVRVGSRPEGAAAAAEGGVWIGVRGEGASHRGGTLRLLNTTPSFDSIDPTGPLAISPTALLGMTNDGLVTFKHVGGADGVALVPDLAVSLPTPTGAGRTYVFKLRRGIRYSTKRRVRAADVRASFERLFRVGSPGTGFYSAIVGTGHCTRAACDLSRGISADDRARTVTFHLTHPDADFLYKLALPFAYVVPATSPPRDTGTRPLPATGPYRIASYRPGRSLRLVRNSEFHEWSQAAQPDGYPDEIRWSLGIPTSRAVTAVEGGKADWVFALGALPAGRRKAVARRYARQLHVNPNLAVEYFVLNTRVAPFDDVRVRRALNLAVDRRDVVALWGGADAAAPTCQILPPNLGGYRRYCPYSYDLQRARRLVADSGTKGMRVRVWDTITPKIFHDEGVIVVRALRMLGYRASLKLVPNAAWDRIIGHTAQTHAQVLSGGWGADFPSASEFIQLKLSCSEFHPEREHNSNPGFCDPAIDRQINRALALQVSRPTEANALWARIDHELVDRGVWLPLVTPRTTDLVSKRVGNYQFHPLWSVLIDQLWVR
jgi:peptide/nickel transport system substrate-binding protein